MAVLGTGRWSTYAGSITLVAGVALAGGSNSSVQSKNCSVGHLGLNLTARGKSLVTPWKMVVIGRSSVSTSSSSIELVATPELLVSWDITL